MNPIQKLIRNHARNLPPKERMQFYREIERYCSNEAEHLINTNLDRIAQQECARPLSKANKP